MIKPHLPRSVPSFWAVQFATFWMTLGMIQFSNSHLLEMFLRVLRIGGFQLWIGEAHACQRLAGLKQANKRDILVSGDDKRSVRIDLECIVYIHIYEYNQNMDMHMSIYANIIYTLILLILIVDSRHLLIHPKPKAGSQGQFWKNSSILLGSHHAYHPQKLQPFIL